MKLKVLGVSEYEGRQSYKVLYEGQEYYVGQYKFQETENIPNELDCNIKIMGDRKVSIMQNIIPFLEEKYTVGGVYDFVVRNDFTRSGYYELVDSNGFYFRLNSRENVTLYVGQEVTCRVIDMMGTSISLDLLSYDDSGLLSNNSSATQNGEFCPQYLSDYISQGKFSETQPIWHLDELVHLVFTNEEPYDTVVNCWILGEIERLREDNTYGGVITILKQMRDAVLYVLEETNCLDVCDAFQRKAIQNRLSTIGMATKNYLKVVGYFEKGQAEDKVDRILNNLNASGYIFQATKQLGIMMRIFSLDKEMMEQKMMIFFNIIHGKDVNYWKNEPFRTAFIKLLELFISVKKVQVDLGNNSDVKNVKQILEALSIQMLLASPKMDGDIFDYNLNRATLYRYASYLKTSTPRHSLQNAFLSLMDVNQATAEYSWADTSAHGLLASKLSTDINRGKLSTYSKVYKEGRVKLDINDDGMVIESLQGPNDKLKPALPAHLLPWNNIQIRLQDNIPAVNPLKEKNLQPYVQLWNNIERTLFNEESRKVVQQKKKGKPIEGETYGVRVLYKNNEGRLVCRIVDDNVEGDGYMSPKDIVPYNLNMHPSLFRNPETGNSLLFDVRVVNIDAEEMCHFSAQRYINEMISEDTDYVHIIPCLVTGHITNENEDTLLAVSHDGFSVRLCNADEFPNIAQGDIVFAHDWEFAGNCCFKANILSTEGVSSHVFTIDEAFSRLMYKLSYDDYAEFEENVSTEVLQQENLIDHARVEELMSVIDRLASLETDYLITYNYLGFAKMMAKMVNNSKRYSFYCGWMKLIAILHHFAVNGAVSSASLNEFEQSSIHLFSKQSEIHRRYLQLKIVSYKGKAEYNNELWEFTRQEDELLRSLAESVLAYNFLGASANESTLHGIDERIQDLLKIKDNSLKLKDFGEEDLHNEFKTSIVYPSDNHMQPNLPLQTGEILKEVCALLNAEGGNLYIGVNNCGAGVGIQTDLKYAEFNGSKDKYDLYFHNNVCSKIGKNEDAYLRTEFKEYMGRTVYEIHIQPCPHPVRLDGIIYERHGSSKVRMEGDNERLFIERRQQQCAGAQQENAKISGQTDGAIKTEQTDNETLPAPLHSKKRREEDTIHVSRLRRPAPFSYDECPDIIRYIQFVEDNYQLVPEYYAEEEEVFLTLAVKEDDRDKYLILAYEDGKVCKIPMSNILDKEDYKSYSRYTGKRLVFVEIATDEDLLMSIGKHKRNGNCLRFDTVENIVQRETMNAAGEPVCTASLEGYVQFDIISANKKLIFRENTDLNIKQPGRVVKNSSDKYFKQLEEMGILEA